MAKTFLKSTDTRHIVTNSDTSIFGSYGQQSVIINPNSKRVIIDANVENVQFAGAISNYKFKQIGNRLDVYDSTGLVSKIGVQDDADGTQLTFVNGSLNALNAKIAPIMSVVDPALALPPTITGIGITVGGTNVSLDNASGILPIDTPFIPIPFPVDLTPPICRSAVVSEDGKTVTLIFDKDLNTISATVSMFNVLADGMKIVPTAVIIDNSTATLTLGKPAGINQEVVVDYNSPITLSSLNTNSAIQDLAGNDTESFSIKTTNNSTIDSIAPVLLTSEVSGDGMRIILTYGETLAPIEPPITAYTIKAGVTATDLATVAVTNVDVSNSIVVLTLNKPITIDQNIVNVGYNAPIGNLIEGSAAIQDIVGNNSISLTNQPAQNNSSIPPDVLAPVCSKADISEDGKSIVLGFDEFLNIKTAAPSMFGISVDGSTTKMAATAVTVQDSTVVLSLAKAVAKSEMVTVSYNAPVSNSLKTNAAIQDFVGNDAAKLTIVPTNNSTVSNFEIKSASNPIVEGKSSIFTVTKNSAVAADTTYLWTISPADKGLVSATTDDVSPSYGSVTILTGKNTGTFSLTAVTDNTPEGFENFHVKLLDTNFNDIGITGSIVISDSVATF